jgi:NTP pyrophosphatase (non-canonical NTP hydrolase)
MSLDILTEKITEWGVDKNIFGPNVQDYYIANWSKPPGLDNADADYTVARAKAQLNKTIEEVKELETAIMNARYDERRRKTDKDKQKNEIKDAIGDIYVTLVMQAGICGVEMEECVEYAYNQIKDRKGKLVDLVFVKEEEEETVNS